MKFRIHLSTYFVLIIVTGIFMAINVYPRRGFHPEFVGDYITDSVHVDFGFPFTFCTVTPKNYWNAMAGAFSLHPLTDFSNGKFCWHYLGLAMDSIAGLFFLAISWYIYEVLIRMRSIKKKFTSV